MKPDSREASHLSLANNRQKISDIQGKYINIDSIFTKLNILRQIYPIFLIFYWDWGLDWEATARATLEFPPLGTTNAVCLRASELLWKIGLNSRKQILGGFMANPIQLADFWTRTRRAAGRKRFLNVLTKNVWNAGDREMSTSSPKQNVGGLINNFQINSNHFVGDHYLLYYKKCTISLTLCLLHNLFFLQSFVPKKQYPGSICSANPDHSAMKPNTYWPMRWYRAHVSEYSLDHSLVVMITTRAVIFCQWMISEPFANAWKFSNFDENIISMKKKNYVGPTYRPKQWYREGTCLNINYITRLLRQPKLVKTEGRQFDKQWKKPM